MPKRPPKISIFLTLPLKLLRSYKLSYKKRVLTKKKQEHVCVDRRPITTFLYIFIIFMKT